jgi:hypothetical protein
MAGATQERKLLGVACKRILGRDMAGTLPLPLHSTGAPPTPRTASAICLSLPTVSLSYYG